MKTSYNHSQGTVHWLGDVAQSCQQLTTFPTVDYHRRLPSQIRRQRLDYVIRRHPASPTSTCSTIAVASRPVLCPGLCRWLFV